jgi:hypothetical protein
MQCIFRIEQLHPIRSPSTGMIKMMASTASQNFVKGKDLNKKKFTDAKTPQ